VAAKTGARKCEKLLTRFDVSPGGTSFSQSVARGEQKLLAGQLSVQLISGRLGRISPVEPATRRTLNANLNRKIHMLDIIIGLISGAFGGNVAGAAMKE
jgi:hypothetical protein